MGARVVREAFNRAPHRARLRTGIPALVVCASAWAAGEAVGAVTGTPFHRRARGSTRA
jgi:hypothetical protein